MNNRRHLLRHIVVPGLMATLMLQPFWPGHAQESESEAVPAADELAEQDDEENPDALEGEAETPAEIVAAPPPAPLLRASELGAFGMLIGVTDSDEAEQQRGYRQALRLVLLRNFRPTLTSLPTVQEAAQSASDYVLEYEYHGADDIHPGSRRKLMTSAARRADAVGLYLQVQFDEAALRAVIDEARETAELPASDPVVAERSAVVWLQVEDGGQRTRIAGDTAKVVVERASELAGGLGWQLQFPVLEGSLAEAEFSSDEHASLRQRATEHPAGQVVVATLTRDQAGLRWQGRWHRYPLMADADVTGLPAAATDVSGETLDAALQQGIAWMSGTEAATLQVRLDDAPALVWVGGFTAKRGYPQVLDWLRSGTSVERVQLVELQPQGGVFSVTPQSALEGLRSRTGNTSWLTDAAGLSEAQSGGLAARAQLLLEIVAR